MAAAATFVWKKEEGETRNAGPSDCSLTWPVPATRFDSRPTRYGPGRSCRLSTSPSGFSGPEATASSGARSAASSRAATSIATASESSFVVRTTTWRTSPDVRGPEPETPAATSASRIAKAIRLARCEWTGHSETATTSFVPRAKCPIARPDGPASKTNAAFCRKRHGIPSVPGGMPIVGSTRGASFPIERRRSTSSAAALRRSCSG